MRNCCPRSFTNAVIRNKVPFTITPIRFMLRFARFGRWKRTQWRMNVPRFIRCARRNLKRMPLFANVTAVLCKLMKRPLKRIKRPTKQKRKLLKPGMIMPNMSKCTTEARSILWRWENCIPAVIKKTYLPNSYPKTSAMSNRLSLRRIGQEPFRKKLQKKPPKRNAVICVTP